MEGDEVRNIVKGLVLLESVDLNAAVAIRVQRLEERQNPAVFGWHRSVGVANKVNDVRNVGVGNLHKVALECLEEKARFVIFGVVRRCESEGGGGLADKVWVVA